MIVELRFKKQIQTQPSLPMTQSLEIRKEGEERKRHQKEGKDSAAT